MNPKVLTETEIHDLADRTQGYIDRLHEFAQEEAQSRDIPVSVALPAVIGWAIGIARMAGIDITRIALGVSRDPDKPPYH